MTLGYNAHHQFNGDEGDEYPAFSIREAWPWTESRAQKPRGRKEHSGAGAPNTLCRRTRLFRVKEQSGLPGDGRRRQLGWYRGGIVHVPVPSFVLGTVFSVLRRLPDERKEAVDDENDDGNDAAAGQRRGTGDGDG